MDVNPAELEESKFQPGIEELNIIRYSENLDDNSMNLETVKLRDESNFRISDNLNELNETRGDGSELDKPLGTDKFERGMMLALDLIKLYTRVKSRWLFMIKNDGITVEYRFLLIITSDAPSICKFYILWSNVLYSRLLKTADLEDGVRRRIAQQRSRPVTEEMSLLLTHAGEKVWGEKRIGIKVDMLAQIVGFKPKINTGKDQVCMQRYVTRVSKSGLNMPTMLSLEQFLPAGAPLLDFLIHDTRKPEGWKFPKLEVPGQPRFEPGDARRDRSKGTGVWGQLRGGDH